MRNKRYLIIYSIFAAVIVFGFGSVLAKGQQQQGGAPEDKMFKISGDFSTSTEAQNKNTEENQIRQENSDKEQGEKNREEEQNRNSEEYQNKVQATVEKLNQIADRDGGIGKEVREVAKEQGEAMKEVTEAIKKVEERNSFKTFLIGTDYKNVGAVRSGIETTENRISRLEKALEKATDESVKAELTKEITALKETQTKLNSFVSSNEGKFSLFGWFVKLFNK